MNMRLGFRDTGISSSPDANGTERYVFSVVDSDGDTILTDVLIRAHDCAAAWQEAMTMALRACRGSGAVPMTLKLVREASRPVDENQLA